MRSRDFEKRLQLQLSPYLLEEEDNNRKVIEDNELVNDSLVVELLERSST